MPQKQDHKLRNPWIFTFCGNLIKDGTISTKTFETDAGSTRSKDGRLTEAEAFLIVIPRAMEIFEEPHLTELPRLQYHK